MLLIFQHSCMDKDRAYGWPVCCCDAQWQTVPMYPQGTCKCQSLISTWTRVDRVRSWSRWMTWHTVVVEELGRILNRSIISHVRIISSYCNFLAQIQVTTICSVGALIIHALPIVSHNWARETTINQWAGSGLHSSYDSVLVLCRERWLTLFLDALVIQYAIGNLSSIHYPVVFNYRTIGVNCSPALFWFKLQSEVSDFGK